MPEKSWTASGCAAKLPEVVNATTQYSSNQGKINLSVEEENALLREQNHLLLTENAILKEREITLARDGIETLNVVIEALRTTHPGKETARFLKDSEERIESASPEDRPLIVNARIKAAAAMIRDAPAPVVEGEDRFSYTTRTRTENRALALVDHLERTSKTVIKMPEARAVLETHEGKPLDRKVVWRAMKTAQGLLRATKDTVWGVGRLILSCPLVSEGGDEGGTVPRPRRDRVPWGG